MSRWRWRWRWAVPAAAPYAGMVAAECLDVGLTTLSKAAMTEGMSHFVFVLYSNALATLLLFPFSFLLHRSKPSPPLSFPLLCRFFLLGLIGITIMQNCVFTGVSYSSPTLGSAMANLVPALTFLLAVLFRMESINFRSLSGQAKVIGTALSISGAMVVTLYKGIAIMTPSLNEHHYNHLLPPQEHIHNSLPEQNWVIGGIYLAVAAFCVSIWNNLQAATVKSYLAELTIISYNSLFATVQCAVVCLVAERDLNAWRLRPDKELISVVYSAAFGSAVTPSIQTWCMHKKGPVFVAIFKPVGIAIAAFMSSFFLGDTLYLGSMVGAIIIIIGFYCVIWGQTKDETNECGHYLEEARSETLTQRMPLLQGSAEVCASPVHGERT